MAPPRQPKHMGQKWWPGQEWLMGKCCQFTGLKAHLMLLPIWQCSRVGLASSESFSHQETVLVPARWSKCTLASGSPCFSGLQVWGKNDLSEHRAQLAPVQPWFVTSRLLLLGAGNGSCGALPASNNPWAEAGGGGLCVQLWPWDGKAHGQAQTLQVWAVRIPGWGALRASDQEEALEGANYWNVYIWSSFSEILNWKLRNIDGFQEYQKMAVVNDHPVADI